MRRKWIPFLRIYLGSTDCDLNEKAYRLNRGGDGFNSRENRSGFGFHPLFVEIYRLCVKANRLCDKANLLCGKSNRLCDKANWLCGKSNRLCDKSNLLCDNATVLCVEGAWTGNCQSFTHRNPALKAAPR